jgi:sodium transport system permease protein
MVLVMGQNLLLNDEIASSLDLTVSLGAFMALALTILCIALLFSALMMAVAVLARSFKEAQTYVTPVYLICILPAMVAQLPGFEYSPAVGLIPAVGPILLMKAILMTGVNADALLLVCGSTTVYALLTLVVAARLFGQESVIVGERGGVQLVPRRSQLKPVARPPLEAALAWFCVLFVLFFYLGSALQTADLHWGLVATLWGVMLAPTIALSAWAKWDLDNTFSARAPAARVWPAALVLAVSGVIVVGNLNVLIESLGLKPPTAYLEQMGGLIDSPEGILGWAAAFFVLAITPAICEEFLFRGFLLSSLKGRVNDWAAIGLTAVLFGLFHLDVYRFFGTTALGVLLGYMTLRTRSVLPAVAMHAINNGIAVALMAAGADEMNLEVTPSLVLLLVAAVSGLVWSLKWLSKEPRR